MLCPAEEADETAAKVRRVIKAQSAEESSPERRKVQQDLEKFEEEARAVHAPPIPMTPSRAEVAAHRLTHRPYRAWCPHCVRGKGRADQHRQSGQKGEFSEIPKLVSDYFFIGQKRPPGREERQREEEAAEKEGQTPIIVIKDTPRYIRPCLSMQRHTWGCGWKDGG